MAQINENKLKAIIEHIRNGGELTKDAICKAGKLNPRYKSWENYLVEGNQRHPDEIPAKLPPTLEEPAPTPEEENDPELSAMLGEDEPECPEGKTGDECCGDPANCTKQAEPKPAPVVEKATSTPKPSGLKVDLDGVIISLVNEKGLSEPLQVKAYTGKRLVLEHKKDEIVKVDIQGVVVEINLSQLEATGKAEEAAFYRARAK